MVQMISIRNSLNIKIRYFIYTKICIEKNHLAEIMYNKIFS